MTALFHLVFEFIRVFILSFIYGFALWLIFKYVFKEGRLKKRVIIPLIFISLFVWRFSYWRNNGFGDSSRVPLTSEYEISIIDSWSASLYKNGKGISQEGDTNGIIKLYEEDNIIYGQTRINYLIFNISSSELKRNLTESEFIANSGELSKLMTPDRFHMDYWGWKILFY